jgi:hypothetical protein
MESVIQYAKAQTSFDESLIKRVIGFSILNQVTDEDYEKQVEEPVPMETWKISSKKGRLTVKPLILLKNGKLLFGKEMLVAASNLFLIGSANGKWTYSRNLLTEKLRSVLEKIEKEAAKNFEMRTYDKVKLTADICKRNLFKHTENLDEEFLKLIKQPCPGEIDVFSIHSFKKTITLWEVKYLFERFGSRDNINDLKEFEEDYIPKVTKKMKFIQDNISKILEYYKIDYKGQWQVKTVFVLPQESLLQLILKSKVPNINFIAIENITEFIRTIKLGNQMGNLPSIDQALVELGAQYENNPFNQFSIGINFMMICGAINMGLRDRVSLGKQIEEYALFVRELAEYTTQVGKGDVKEIFQFDENQMNQTLAQISMRYYANAIWKYHWYILLNVCFTQATLYGFETLSKNLAEYSEYIQKFGAIVGDVENYPNVPNALFTDNSSK